MLQIFFNNLQLFNCFYTFAGDSSTYQWNVSDCLRFQELVCDKNFVSKVHSIDADELNKTDKILTLTLIDTSSEEDIYITSDFIKAKHKSESEP